MTSIQQQGPSEQAALDHRGLRVMRLAECLERLGSTPIGRVSFHDGSDLVILPVNHVVDTTSIAFRTRWDSRLASAVGGHQVAFEVDDYDASTQTGWSVLVKGVAENLYDEAVGGHLEELLGVPWTGEPEEAFWIRIRPEEISGREQGATRKECGCC